MGRVVVVNFVSIDGVIHAPLSPEEDRDGDFEHGGWVPPYSDDTVNAFMQRRDESRAAGLLSGRRSYEILADAWASADDSEAAVAAPESDAEVRDLVLSRGAPVAELPTGSVPTCRAPSPDLKERTDGDLVVFGAGALVRGLAEHDLVDEYCLLVFPLVLGDGKRMFDERGHLARFILTDSVVASTGVVILTYTRDRSS